ncbi:MAG: HdeD family acid-resistance protein [Candidatus Promineifilaceae bacterium]
MLRLLTRNWWLVALRGLFAILFGVVAMIWPGITVQALVIVFGVYAVVDGVLSSVTAVGNRKHYPRWGLVLLNGQLSIMAGVMAFVWPSIAALVLLFLIAAWTIVTGLFEVAGAIALRRELEGEGWLVLSGILSVLFGLAVVIWPGAGALALIWLIAAYAIVFGITLIALGFRLRRVGQELKDQLGHAV